MKRYRWLIPVFAILLLLGGVFAYVMDYYRASPEALVAAESAFVEDGNLFFAGEQTTGFILYPGGKVDEKAYAPLAQLLQKQGYPVAIAKVPAHLSILDSNRAQGIIASHSEITRWILVGHSLGGTSASIFAQAHPDQIYGIVFLGSYPYKDLSGTDLMALTIVGSDDLVLNRQKSQESLSFYPTQNKSILLPGGNHAQFGSYGIQKGDGVATITHQEQQELTSSYILDYFFGNP